VEAIKKISVYVSQLRRVGKGHGNCLLNLVNARASPLYMLKAKAVFAISAAQ